MDMAALIESSIFEAQRHFRHLHRHGEPADYEHPENSAWPAHRQRHRHTCDVAKADRPGKRCRERTPLADVTLCFARARLRSQDADRAPDSAYIWKAEPDSEEQHGHGKVEDDQLNPGAEHGHLEEDRT